MTKFVCNPRLLTSLTCALLFSGSLFAEIPNEEPQERSVVRVRTTVTLCLPAVTARVGGQSFPILPVEGTTLRPTELYRLSDNTVFDYCGSPVPYE